MPSRPALRLLRPGETRCRTVARSLLGRCSFPPVPTEGAPPVLDCAVSGGPDSLALLALAVEAGFRPVAHHVDHGLRAGSAAELEAVKSAVAALNLAGPEAQQIEVVGLRVAVAPGPNLEARARTARFGVLPAGVATGHTADDQAETVLINLLRGSSTAGLSGMRAGARHPILGVRRSDTRAVCNEAGLQPLEDPSNADPVHLRNRIRHELLPGLNELAGRDLVPLLCRQSELLAEDEGLLQALAAALDVTNARELAGAARPLARRAVREWLKDATGSTHPPSAATVERVLRVASGAALACDVGGGFAVRRRRGRLVIESGGMPPVR